LTLQVDEIMNCRVCKEPVLIEILDLGLSEISSYFPLLRESDPPRAPLILVECAECGLVQLKHNVDQDFLFGNTYGYRTGINPSMQSHVEGLAVWLTDTYNIQPGAKVLDIGSNDGTFLNKLVDKDFRLYGVDPNYEDMAHFYSPHIIGKKAFFDAKLFAGLKFDLITSVAMFYDVNDPVDFACQIRSLLSESGIWYLEQSYLIDMLQNNSFDTICHEHLLYYSLETLSRIMGKAGLKVVGINRSKANGGSLGIAVAHIDSEMKVDAEIQKLLSKEIEMRRELIINFTSEVQRLKAEINKVISEIIEQGKSIWGVGASTKGNTILSFLGLDSTKITAIADKNPLKLGRVTPGTRIPIVAADELYRVKPDYALVLPWHFRDFIIEDERNYLKTGGELMFPLPNLEIISWDEHFG